MFLLSFNLYTGAVNGRELEKDGVYLTFDDGPEEKTTKWLLDILKRENIKATFFCLGKQIENHPVLFQKILDNGHAIGNHTFNHEKGSITECKTVYRFYC